MPCRLDKLSPLYCSNDKNNACSIIPNPILFSNIPLLWKFLELVVKDWEIAVAPIQKAINSALSEEEKDFYFLQGFYELQPHFLKCLFSYAFFFASLDNAYNKFYAELKGLSNPSLGIKHIKNPTVPPYIYKVKKIRNISIAHMISKEKNPLDVEASTMWQPLTLERKINEERDLNKIIFGGFKVVSYDSKGNINNKSCDLEIKGIYEMDIQCKDYLDKFDKVCADYLMSIQAKLPITIDNKTIYCKAS